MGLYASDHPDVPGMRGLHLFHFVLSNCSQRVRIGLEEKGLAWTSHHVNLPANEHVTSDYQRIHPGGVVPALVHDGQVVIESNDILVYLDEQFPQPPLRPSDPAMRARLDDLVRAAAAFQPTIKVLSHELLFRPFRQVGEAEVALYEQHHRDPALVSFLRDYAEAGPAWQARVRQARAELSSALEPLESALGETTWLSGDAFGLADVSWVVNAHRLQQARVELGAWPRFQDWAARASARPAFERAVLEYRP